MEKKKRPENSNRDNQGFFFSEDFCLFVLLCETNRREREGGAGLGGGGGRGGGRGGVGGAGLGGRGAGGGGEERGTPRHAGVSSVNGADEASGNPLIP